MMEEVSSVSPWYKRERVGLTWLLSKEETHELPARDKEPENFVILLNFCNSLYSLCCMPRHPPHHGQSELSGSPFQWSQRAALGKSSASAFLLSSQAFLTW